MGIIAPIRHALVIRSLLEFYLFLIVTTLFSQHRLFVILSSIIIMVLFISLSPWS